MFTTHKNQNMLRNEPIIQGYASSMYVNGLPHIFQKYKEVEIFMTCHFCM